MGDRTHVIGNSLEDKLAWCTLGQNYEEEFVDKIAPLLGLNIKINPEKAYNKYANDLIFCKSTGETFKAELKRQNSIYTAPPGSNLDSNYLFTFNQKDYLRYKSFYPELILFFWVNRVDQLSKTIFGQYHLTEPIVGVWAASFKQVARQIESGQLYTQTYAARVNDTGTNAKISYVLDLRRFKCLWATSPLVEHRSLKGVNSI